MNDEEREDKPPVRDLPSGYRELDTGEEITGEHWATNFRHGWMRPRRQDIGCKYSGSNFLHITRITKRHLIKRLIESKFASLIKYSPDRLLTHDQIDWFRNSLIYEINKIVTQDTLPN